MGNFMIIPGGENNIFPEHPGSKRSVFSALLVSNRLIESDGLIFFRRLRPRAQSFSGIVSMEDKLWTMKDIIVGLM